MDSSDAVQHTRDLYVFLGVGDVSCHISEGLSQTWVGYLSHLRFVLFP